MGGVRVVGDHVGVGQARRPTRERCTAACGKTQQDAKGGISTRGRTPLLAIELHFDTTASRPCLSRRTDIKGTRESATVLDFENFANRQGLNREPTLFGNGGVSCGRCTRRFRASCKSTVPSSSTSSNVIPPYSQPVAFLRHPCCPVCLFLLCVVHGVSDRKEERKKHRTSQR